jgi:ketosteroid isomerase-like protein
MTTVSEEEQAEVVRRALLAINREDEEAFLAMLHPDVEWHSNTAGLMPTDVWQGRDAVREGRQLAAAGGRHVRTTLQEIRVAGDQVLVLGVVTSETPHRGHVMLPISWIWTIREGLALRVESFRSRFSAEAAFENRMRAGG